VDAAGRALVVAAEASVDDVVLVLLSGGASAMMALPARGLTLDDKRHTVSRLLAEGAPIFDLNTVRKHISAIKGGRLAEAAAATMITLALSDVVGDEPSTIASGPTVADPTTFADALAVLERFGGADVYPRAVVARMRAGVVGMVGDTPKPGASAFRRTRLRVIGSARDALAAATRAATALGYRVRVVAAPTTGEARAAAVPLLAGLVRWQTSDPLCLLASGETTVTIKGPGKGGRNQELALAMAPILARLGADIVAACVGTDGVDGPTDAAGALVDRTTSARARAAGLDVETALGSNDSYDVFDRLGDLIRTGPTGTNVGDLQVILAGGATREVGSQQRPRAS
jgi:glycerate-2-kinase